MTLQAARRILHPVSAYRGGKDDAMTRQSTVDARDRIAESLETVEKTGEAVLFERDGRPVAALVSAEDYQLLEHLREEDRLDAEEADRILSEAKPEDFIPLEKVKKDLGL